MTDLVTDGKCDVCGKTVEFDYGSTVSRCRHVIRIVVPAPKKADRDLKPCPFKTKRTHNLAVQAVKDSSITAIRVTCSCGAEGPCVEGNDRDAAISAWNTRK